MSEVSAYEAKTHLAQLLERVRQGERIVITRHGTPVAELGPTGAVQEADADALFEAFARLRSRTRLGADLTLKELVEEGRR
jgi:prevent-host-death family protein